MKGGFLGHFTPFTYSVPVSHAAVPTAVIRPFVLCGGLSSYYQSVARGTYSVSHICREDA